MSNNPINLALRFLLEVAALVSIGYWGWSQADGALRLLLGLGMPALAAAAWGAFRVPGDASASGKALVAVPGLLRLALELGLFAWGVGGLAGTGLTPLAGVLAAAVAVHYVISYDRIAWLLKQ